MFSRSRLAPAMALASAFLFTAIVHAGAQTLAVGDPAPKLAVKEFVKGTPVTSFAKGKNYVVEFWATWCGPCRVSIPHLTELQKKYKSVTFIGVSVFEDDPSKVKPFVTEMGSKMGYCIAMEKVPAGGKRGDGEMAKSWMIASGQKGIPTAFIVNGEGKVAWIGHPSELEKPLEQVIAGKLDIAKVAADQKKTAAQQSKMETLQGKLQQAAQSGDPKKMLAALDKIIADDPSTEALIGVGKLTIMGQTGADPAKILEYGHHLYAVVKNDPMQLNGIAWVLVDPERPKPSADAAKFSLEVAQKADELAKQKDPAIADTLGRAYFVNGNVTKALDTQERAVKLSKGTQFEQDKTITDRLEQYRKAAAEKK